MSAALDLPPHFVQKDYLPDYGARKLLAVYIGSQTSDLIEGHWQHAWIGRYRNVHPELVVGGNGNSFRYRKRSAFYVARQDQVDFLRECGYRDVVAIGNPVVYLPKIDYARIPGSLLIMPMHSLPDTSENWESEGEKYLHFLRPFLNDFDFVVACLHPSCLEKRFWVDSFESEGIECIRGSDPHDQNSLYRTQALFSQFDVLTTNGFGSQVAYAAYFGCKVSVAGPRPIWDPYARTDRFFRNCPEALPFFTKWRSTDALERLYPELVKSPTTATIHEDWGNSELGSANKRMSDELRKILKKTLNRKFKGKFYSVADKLQTWLGSL